MARLVALLSAMAFAVAGAVGPPAVAVAADRAQGEQYLAGRLVPGATLSNYLDRLRADCRQLDADADGVLTQADAAIHEAVAVASARAGVMMMIMRADLDGDGAVTADEERRMLRYDRRNQPARPGGEAAIEAEVRRTMEADTDGDGRISLAEAQNVFAKRPERQRAQGYGPAASLRQLLNLAPSADRVTPDDLMAAATEFFNAVDADGNGTISQDEYTEMRRHAQQRRARSPARP